VDEFEDKLKELEDPCDPIMSTMFQGAGGGGLRRTASTKELGT